MSKSRLKRINEQKRETKPEASSTESTAAYSPMPGRLVNANLVNVRTTPEINGDNVMTQIDRTEKFGILTSVGEFKEVVLEDGRKGYIHSNFCEVSW